MNRTRYSQEHVSILNTLDHGGEMHAFEIGTAQSVSKMLAKLRRNGLVHKRVVSEGVSALWSITDAGRAFLSGETRR